MTQQMPSSLELLIRPYAPECDERYVLACWTRGMAAAVGVDVLACRALVRALVTDLMRRSEVTVLCAADRPDHILGWLAGERDCLHWVHTKAGLGVRRQGLATMLVRDRWQSGPITCSITTSTLRPGLKIWDRWGLRLDARRLEHATKV